MFGFGRKKAMQATPVEECRHEEHPDAIHWHYGYGNRHASFDGPVRDDFSNDTTQWAKGVALEDWRNQ